MNSGWGISNEIALRWMPLDLTDDKSTLVQVMAWCRQAASHYLNQCWPRSLSPNGVTRPQWVNSHMLAHWVVLSVLQMTENIVYLIVSILYHGCFSRWSVKTRSLAIWGHDNDLVLLEYSSFNTKRINHEANGITVEPLYNTIVFHQNTHKRHPKARP